MRKFLLAAVSVLVLSNVAFAQQDIGELLFRSILKISQYPGSPFTGNPINDLVMFFLIPTIFLFLFLWIILERFHFSPKLKLLFGLAMYLFVIFSGYFAFFALLVGPYLFIMIFIIGALFFIGWHFRRPAGGGPYREGGHGGKGGAALHESGITNPYIGMSWIELGRSEQRIKRDLRDLENQLGKHRKRVDDLYSKGQAARVGEDPTEAQLEVKITQKREELRMIEDAKKISRKII